VTRAQERRARLRARPQVFRLFGWLLAAATGMNVLSLVIYAPRFRAEAIAQGNAAAGWFVAILITVVINSVLWWRIAICAGRFARWIYIGLLAASLLQLPQVYAYTVKFGLAYGLMTATAFALAMCSSAILLRPDVSRWLRSDGLLGEVDPADFE